MKKIAILIPELSGRGGMETAFVNLYKIMEESSDYKPTFVFTNGVQKVNYLKNFPANAIIYKNKSTILKQLLFLINIISSNKYDMFIVTSKRLIILSTYLKRILHINVPIISWMHFSLSKEGIYINLRRYGDAHLAISKEIYSQIREMGVDEDKIFYLPNYVDSHDSLISTPKEIKYIYVGRIEFLKQKNLKELIDGVASLNYKWTLYIYGDGNDKKLCQDYIERKYPWIKEKIKWKGWMSDPWDDIKTGSALILTSIMEGMPMVLIEALSRGLPVLSSDCPTGPKDIIKSGINGYLYKMGDLSDFREKLYILKDNKLNRSSVKQSVSSFSKKQYIINLKKALESFD